MMTTAIERHQGPQTIQAARPGLEPQNFSEVARLAEYVAKSGMFAVKTQEQAMMVMLTGASLGLSPVAALRGVHVIQGRAALDATLVAGLCQQHPDCEYWRVAQSTNDSCTIETKRRSSPQPVTKTWTIEDAKRAGLIGKDTWKSYPAAMLRSRCTTELARMVYGDALFGVYAAEELESIPAQSVAHRAEVSQAVPAQAALVVSVADDLIAKIAQCASLKDLQSLSASSRKAVAALSDIEKGRVNAAYAARKAELSGPKDDGPKNGHVAPAQETAEAAGESEASESTGGDIVAAWTEQVGAIKEPPHALNWIAAHIDEVPAAVRDACLAAGARRLRAWSHFAHQNVEAIIQDAIAKREQRAA